MTLCEFRNHRTLEKPDTNLDTNSVIAVLLFIFGLFLLGSRFVFSPGMEIQIPKVQNIDLRTTVGILNIGINGLLMFDNRILKLEELGEKVALFLSHKKFPNTVTLLVCIDQSVPFGWVIRVIDTLKSAGCQNIQIACDSQIYSQSSN